MVKVLHTSDWHIGRNLYGKKRYREFEQFLTWLVEQVTLLQVDVLLIAGDIFDTTTPSNKAQQLYYRFLHQVSATRCEHVVIIGGNHDSPTFLNAPKELLGFMNIHVVGAAAENIEDEIILLKNQSNTPQLIVCAVPYLRERDIRLVREGETADDKVKDLTEQIAEHYRAVGEIALTVQKSQPITVPIIGMGHLFAAGGSPSEGVRELYVGNVAQISGEIFPKCMTYVALGHLHVPQKVNGSPVKRYSGSPIPMGFGEASQEKKVLLITLTDTSSQVVTPNNPELIAKVAEGIITPNEHRGDRLHPLDDIPNDHLKQKQTTSKTTSQKGDERAKITEITVPCFQKLLQVKGDLSSIESQLREIEETHPDAWLEITYTGEQLEGDLRAQLESYIENTQIEIRRIINKRIIEKVMAKMAIEETLTELTAEDVFKRCLDSQGICNEQRTELSKAFAEILQEINETDERAE